MKGHHSTIDLDQSARGNALRSTFECNAHEVDKFLLMQELDDAIECFTKAQELDSTDPAIPKELTKAKQARSAAEKKQRATYAKMFG